MGLLHSIAFIFILIASCSCFNHSDDLTKFKFPPVVIARVAYKLEETTDWIKRSLFYANEDTFVGRCVGAIKRLRSALIFIIIALVVIVVKLGYLTLFSLKTLGIGVLLLIINAGGIFSKFVHSKHVPQSKPQNIHYHLHGQKHPEVIYPSGWVDRDDLSSTKISNYLQRLELTKLYERLGISRDTLFDKEHSSLLS